MKVRNYKYKIRMNRKFLAACETTLEGCRDLYNAALHQRREAYRVQGKSVSWVDQDRELTEARTLPEVGAVLRTLQTQTLKKLERAYKAFFGTVKSSKAKGFPGFKGYERYDSFTTADLRQFRLDGDKLTVQKLGSARLRLSRPLGGKAKQITIKREHDGWYAVFSCEVPDSEPLPATGRNVGIDVGLESFAVLSTGTVIKNPRYFRKGEAELGEAQRGLARKQRGSNSRKRAKRIVQSCHAKIQRQRAWFHWHEARKLVKDFDAIVVEDLNVKGMVKSNLAKSIHDAGWAGFIQKLSVKAEDAGRLLVRVSARYTSQDCSKCGKRIKKELSQRWHSCDCGAELHRDLNAALNILGRAFPVSESERIFTSA